MQLADQIDPKRINAAIPDTQQRVLAIGSSDPVVARILLTAHTLFEKKFLGSSFEQEKGLTLALELPKNIAPLTAARVDLEAAEAQARGQHTGRPPKLTPQQQKETRRRRAGGATLGELTKSYNVGRATISRLR